MTTLSQLFHNSFTTLSQLFHNSFTFLSLVSTAGSSHVNNLLQSAGNLGKAVGVLVHVMTDDEGGSDNDTHLNINNNKPKQ